MTLELQSSTQSKKMRLPGPPSLPIFGSLPFLLPYLNKFPERSLTKLASKYGDIYQLRLGNKNIVVFNKLEAILQANLRQPDDFASRPEVNLLQSAADGGTVGAKKHSKLWKRHREIAQNVLNIYCGSKSKIEAEVIEAASELVDIFLRQGGQPFDPEFETVLAISGVAYWILFGERQRSREDTELIELIGLARGFVGNSALSVMGDMMPLIRKIFKNRLTKVQDALDALKKLSMKHLKEHKQNMIQTIYWI